MGLSIRAYARHRGVSDAAVRKAIATGRVTPNADGTLDPAQADAQWARNTDRAQQRTAQAMPMASSRSRGDEQSPAGVSAGGTTFNQARTANEVLKAQANKLRVAQLKGELVDRAQAVAQVFALARAERDAWLNWSARVSATLAAALDVDAHALHAALESAVHAHLTELGEVRPRIDG